MKMILLTVISIAVLSCKNESSESEVNEIQSKIEEAGAEIGYISVGLSRETNVGQAALKTESLRESKAVLERLIAENADVVTETRARKIADAARERAATSLKKALEENERYLRGL